MGIEFVPNVGLLLSPRVGTELGGALTKDSARALGNGGRPLGRPGLVRHPGTRLADMQMWLSK